MHCPKHGVTTVDSTAYKRFTSRARLAVPSAAAAHRAAVSPPPPAATALQPASVTAAAAAAHGAAAAAAAVVIAVNHARSRVIASIVSARAMRPTAALAWATACQRNELNDPKGHTEPLLS